MTFDKKDVKLSPVPITTAIQVAVKNVRVNFFRSLITASGIMLGIAFLASVFTSIDLTKISASVNPAEALDQTWLARQYWLIVMSLLVCFVGIVNAMLMSVLERFKTIGTMKCLGATDKFINHIFLFESMFMGGSASMAGSFVGIALMTVVFSLRHKVFALGMPGAALKLLMWFAVCTIIGAVLSILAAVYPARTAAKMPPAMALRSEI